MRSKKRGFRTRDAAAPPSAARAASPLSTAHLEPRARSRPTFHVIAKVDDISLQAVLLEETFEMCKCPGQFVLRKQQT